MLILYLHFDSELQNLDGTGTYAFISGTSFISGNTTAQDWEETEDPKLISVDQVKHEAVVQFNALYKIKIGIKGIGFEISTNKIIDIKIDTRTGQMIGYSVFTSF